MERDAVGQLLLQKFTFLGVDFQLWMPIVAGGLALWVVYAATRRW